MPFKSYEQQKAVFAKLRQELAGRFPNQAKGKIILFHGTRVDNLRKIKKIGLWPDFFGAGIDESYLTPDPRTALEFVRD